jgi:seryl-tRNA synthetase
MLDIVYIRNNPQEVSEKLARRGFDIDFTEFLEADAKRRAMMHENEELKAERNRKSAEIPMIKKEGGDISQWTESLRQLNASVVAHDDDSHAVDFFPQNHLKHLSACGALRLSVIGEPL